VISKVAVENTFRTEAAEEWIKYEPKSLEVLIILREGVADLGINLRGEINQQPAVGDPNS
jgi:hypothetical protein